MAGKYINMYVNSSVGIEKQNKIARNFLASTRTERLEREIKTSALQHRR